MPTKGGLLKSYLDLSVLFYRTQDERELEWINAAATQLETNVRWAVTSLAGAQPTPVVALTVSGVDDVLNSHDIGRQLGGSVS